MPTNEQTLKIAPDALPDQSAALQVPDALWRLPVVVGVTGLCKSRVYQLEALGEFPQRVRIGQRAVAWRSSQVRAWVQARTVARQEVIEQ